MTGFEEGFKAICQPSTDIHYFKGSWREDVWGIFPSECVPLVERLSGGRRGGVTGPYSVIGVGDAGQRGTGRVGCGLGRGQIPLPMADSAGKRVVRAGARRHIA